MSGAHRLQRARTWFGLALLFAVLTVAFAFTTFGLATEGLTAICLLVGAARLARDYLIRLRTRS
ncbi:MAG TPA: hypothetical protein VG650_10715 [Mycobacteriales bacterium]|nr:hypothetical protein [Mycobacteriales bacterium]